MIVVNRLKRIFGRFENELSDDEVRALKQQMTPDIASPENIRLLSPLSRRQREDFARRSHTVTLYLGDEVAELVAAEERAAMAAAPNGYPLAALQGLNIGCGDRLISPYLLPVDIMREHKLGEKYGEHGRLTPGAFLARADDLPFRPESIDYIVALHMLEHVEDPVATVHHWLDIVKPGGGIGVVLPDWRYAWDARNDRAPFSHKWNSTPTLIKRLYDEHWAARATLEQLASYNFAASFDFVLRKHGTFVPFAAPAAQGIRSGYQRWLDGVFLHSDD